MADLVVDTDGVRRLDTDLKLVLDVLHRAGTLSQSTKAASGHGELAARINDFEKDWNGTRDDAIDALGALSRLVTAVAENFAGIDLQLTRKLQGR